MGKGCMEFYVFAVLSCLKNVPQGRGSARCCSGTTALRADIKLQTEVETKKNHGFQLE